MRFVVGAGGRAGGRFGFQRGGLLGQFETRFDGLICHQDTINAVSYSPDGRRLASASSDSTIKLWDPFSGSQVGTDGGAERSRAVGKMFSASLTIDSSRPTTTRLVYLKRLHHHNVSTVVPHAHPNAGDDETCCLGLPLVFFFWVNAF